MLGILGRKGVGKDLISDYLTTRYGYNKVAFASTLKDATKVLFGFNNDQLYGDQKEVIDPRWGISPRQAFQWLGTDIFRIKVQELIPKIEDKFWIESALSNTTEKIVISDVRFANEVRTIRERGGKVIKVVREGIPRDDHVSEKGIDLITEYDFIINNQGTIEDLYQKIDQIIEQI